VGLEGSVDFAKNPDGILRMSLKYMTIKWMILNL